MSTYHLAFLKIHYKLTALKYDLNQKPNLTLNNKNIKIESGKKKSSFPLSISLSEIYVNEILKLTEHDATTWAQEEGFVRYLERYRTGLLNNQQLQDK